MSFGRNDALDAFSGLEKLLKTGIAASNATSNIGQKEHVAMSGHVLDVPLHDERLLQLQFLP